MNGDSYFAYREAGALCEEYDPEEPERRTRCTCGAFLPANPTFEGGKVEVERDFGDFNPWTGKWESLWETVTEWLEPTTDCKRCGRVWEEGELWQ